MATPRRRLWARSSRDPGVPESHDDLGFGIRGGISGSRLLLPDGSFNVLFKGLPLGERFSPFHHLISCSWVQFFLLTLGSYVSINLGFTVAYYVISGGQVTAEDVRGLKTYEGWGAFWELFFFSTQTFTTVGYGYVSPSSFHVNALASFESMTGLLYIALTTGLFYGRFARPQARLRFAEHSVVAPYHGSTAWMFRFMNGKANQLIDLHVEVVLSMRSIDENGASRRMFYGLELERSRINFLATTWTVVHPITSDSPIYGLEHKELLQRDAEFIILIRGVEETFMQNVYYRRSYRAEEINWGQRYTSILDDGPNGASLVYADRLHQTYAAELPQPMQENPGGGAPQAAEHWDPAHPHSGTLPTPPRR